MSAVPWRLTSRTPEAATEATALAARNANTGSVQDRPPAGKPASRERDGDGRQQRQEDDLVRTDGELVPRMVTSVLRPLMVAATTSATSPPKRTRSDQGVAVGPASTVGTGAPASSPARSRPAPSMDSATRLPPSGRALSARPPVRGVALNSRGQAGHDHRLAQVVIHARRQALLAVAIHRIGRQRDDRDPGPPRLALPDRARGPVAIELGHLAVEEDDVVGQAAGQVEGLEPVARHIHPTAEALQHQQPTKPSLSAARRTG